MARKPAKPIFKLDVDGDEAVLKIRSAWATVDARLNRRRIKQIRAKDRLMLADLLHQIAHVLEGDTAVHPEAYAPIDKDGLN